MHETATFRIQNRSANLSIGRSVSVLPTIANRETTVSKRRRKWTNLAHSWYISLSVSRLIILPALEIACMSDFFFSRDVTSMSTANGHKRKYRFVHG
jgi:hypothetical protein